MQYSEVKKICDELHKTGKPVSLDYLISKVPGAQASLVVHYQKWRNEQANHAPVSLEADKGMFSSEFVTAFQREAEAHSKKLTDQLNQQLQQAMQAEVLAAEHNRELQQQVGQLEQRKAELETSLQQQQQQLATQSEKFALLGDERDEALSQNRYQSEQLQKTSAELEKSTVELEQLRSELALADQELNDSKTSLAQLQNQLDEVRKQADSAQKLAEQTRAEAEQLQLKLIAAQQAQEELEQQLQSEQQPWPVLHIPQIRPNLVPH